VDVEDATGARDDLDRGDLVLVLLENSRRQTGGVRESASGDAVFDADVRQVGHPFEPTLPASVYAALKSAVTASDVFGA